MSIYAQDIKRGLRSPNAASRRHYSVQQWKMRRRSSTVQAMNDNTNENKQVNEGTILALLHPTMQSPEFRKHEAYW